jgi:protein TonB
MVEKIATFVSNNYNIKIADDLSLQGKMRILVIFKIDKTGRPIGIRARAPHPELEEEAIAVIKKLPKMIPGKQFGQPVTVPYSLPIIFQVKERQKNKQNTRF